MKTKNFLLTGLLIASFTLSVNAQQFLGPNNTTSEINRTGQVGIGLTNSPNDTQLYVRSNNLKVGIVSEATHNVDFQFGILSAVNRSNTKAFSVLLNQSGVFTDTFAVMGDGRVKATEVRVLTPIFPDYVFDKDYNLMPLNQVENYIKVNKHLPNIPSADEVVNGGLDLGNMQVKQMEKIEELFLYIIELEKRLETLEKENAQLQKK